MDSALLVPLALAFGATVGAGVTVVLAISMRHSQRVVDVVSAAVPDGVDQVIEALESAGVVLDPSNSVVKANAGAMAFGLVSANALVHPELVTIINHVRRTGEPVTQQLELARGPFGEANNYLFIRVARLGARYILLLAEDRTEAYRLDQVRRDFVANISHELKTPIGAVGLLAEAMQAASDEPDQVRRFAKRLTKEAERLARITREIIELSRLQAADVLTKRELVEIDHVVSLSVDQTRVAAESNRVTIITGGDAGAKVYGDEPLLAVALHNLIANAIQYSPPSSRVGVGVTVNDSVVEIAVTDQGIGIPDEDRERVFERFYRIDPARSRHTGGSGLGLSIVKHVVQNHGGDIRVWSQPGKGSTFTIRLPVASQARAASLKED